MKNNTKKTLSTYWQHSKRYKISLFIAISSIVGAAITNAIIPLYFKKFFDILTLELNKSLAYEQMFNVLMMILLIEAGHWIFWRFANFSIAYFQTSVIADLDNSSFAKIHKHSFSFFNNNFTGSLVKKVNYFSRAFEVIADITFYDFIPLIVNIIIITTVLFFKSYILGFIIIAWLVVYMLINLVVSHW